MEPTLDHTGDADDGDIPGGGAPEPTRALPIQHRPGAGGRAPSTLVSYYERDTVLRRLKQALAEGRLDGDVFDHRARTALTARTHGELDPLVADLPGAARPAPAPARPAWFAVALKGAVRRAGYWQVPKLQAMFVYRGCGELDLRAAELTGAVTALVAVGYKSTITVYVPPGVRVQAAGVGVAFGLTDSPAPPDAPVVNVRGVAFRGTVEILAGPR
jgi:hypothetical protein